MDVIVGKIDSMRRCVKRVYEEYDNSEENLCNFTRQDSIILNIQRACELAIDSANYIIAKHNMTTPKTSREAFEILRENDIIDTTIEENMKRLIGFRNIAVHDYKKIDVKILKNIISALQNDMDDYESRILSFMKRI